MRVIARQRLMELARKHPNGLPSIRAWYQIISKSDFEDFDSIRIAFPKADMVAFKRKDDGIPIAGHYVIFNINGNHLRLITVIHFNRHLVFIRALLTHADYDKIDLKKGTV